MHRQKLFPRVLRVTRDYYYYSMKPLWSNKGISLPAADIESETEMLRVAELLRYILRFRFAFMAGPRGLKKCAYHLLSIIPANTAEEIYNSATQENTQLAGAGVFLHFFLFYSKVSFLLSRNRVAFTVGFHSRCAHLTARPPQSDRTAAEVSAATCSYSIISLTYRGK